MAAVLGSPVGAWCLCSSASGTQCLAELGRVTQRRLQGEPRHWSQLQLMSLYDFVALFQAKNTPAVGAARHGAGSACSGCGTSQGQPAGGAGVALQQPWG